MIYLNLFLAFLKVGCFAFGGAYGAIPLIRDVVLSYGWLNEEKLTYMIAVSESTPGPIMVNLATYVGSTQAGILGAAVATLGVVLPSFCIILLIMVMLKRALNNRYFQAVLEGLKPCVIGIILATGLQLILNNCLPVTEKSFIDLQAMAITIFLLMVAIMYKKKTGRRITPISLIMISAVAGMIVYGIAVPFAA